MDEPGLNVTTIYTFDMQHTRTLQRGKDAIHNGKMHVRVKVLDNACTLRVVHSACCLELLLTYLAQGR